MHASDSAKPATLQGEPASEIEQLGGQLDKAHNTQPAKPQPRSMKVEQVDVDTSSAALQLHVVSYVGCGDDWIVTTTLDIPDPGALRCRCGATADQLMLIPHIGQPALLKCGSCRRAPLLTLSSDVEKRP
jgi:hypothetical protein